MGVGHDCPLPPAPRRYRPGVDDDLHGRINALAAEEHALRQRHGDGSGLSDEERSRLGQLEGQLDQVWDLLRQREARRRAGQDPATAQQRDSATVEGYLS